MCGCRYACSVLLFVLVVVELRLLFMMLLVFVCRFVAFSVVCVCCLAFGVFDVLFVHVGVLLFFYCYRY